MVLARRAELQAVQLATDVKSLIQWLNRYFSLGWSSLGRAAKIFDFIVEELSRQTLLAHRIRPLRIALKINGTTCWLSLKF